MLLIEMYSEKNRLAVRKRLALNCDFVQFDPLGISGVGQEIAARTDKAKRRRVRG